MTHRRVEVPSVVTRVFVWTEGTDSVVPTPSYCGYLYHVGVRAGVRLR